MNGRNNNPINLLFVILFLITVFCHCSALPNGTETIITTDTAGTLQQAPAIYADQIVWEDSRLGNADIYYYNLSSGLEIQITTDAWDQKNPAIFGNYIVYEDWSSGNADIWMYNLSNATEIPITIAAQDQTNPKIYGDIIVWQDHQNPDWDITYFNLSSGTETPLVYLNDQTTPDVNGNKIIWQDYDGGVTYTIPVYNLTSQNIDTTIATTSRDIIAPVIYSKYIIWQDYDGSTFYYHVNMTDLNDPSITIQITPDSIVGLSDQKNPAIYGNYVVVEDYRGGATSDIYVYDISNLNDITEKLITPNTDGSFQIVPAIYGDRIVWEDQRTDSDIYMLTLGTADTCPFADFTASPASITYLGTPVDVIFTGIPALGVHYLWKFDDGTTSQLKNPKHSYSSTGVHPLNLTVGNLKCRNVTPSLCKYKIFVNSTPVAGFTATPLYGFAPLTVTFTDSSCGGPTSWNWSFDDGTYSDLQHPVHTFQTSGQKFDVALKAKNEFGENQLQKNDYIRTFIGTQGLAFTPINGIITQNLFGNQFLNYNKTTLPDTTNSSSIIVSRPPAGNGWQNITFITDGVGFKNPNDTIIGNLTRVYLKTNDTVATQDSPEIGTGWGVNHRSNRSSYPVSATIRTEIWESAVPDDLNSFTLIASYAGTTLRDVAYTAKFTKQNFASDGIATLNMSVATSWVAGDEGAAAGRTHTFIMGYGYNGNGDKIGAVLDTRYRFTSGSLDFFEADIPQYVDYFTTFSLTKLSGSGNPFQLISLSVSSHISPQSNPSNPDRTDSNGQSIDSGNPIAGTGQHAPSQQNQPEAPAPPSPSSAKSADLYSNDQGIVSQTTVLQSVDQLATISIGQGVKALDATGNPLPSVTIDKISAGQLPGISSPGSLSFAGLAYELQPNGATFSPAITVTFSVPNAQWGKEYSISEFDHSSQTWVDLSTTYHTDSGTISAPVSHFCCIALFSNAITPVPDAHPTVQVIHTAPITAPAPSSAMAIFYGMMLWVGEVCAKNIYLVLILASVAFAFFLKGRKKRLDRVRYKL